MRMGWSRPLEKDLRGGRKGECSLRRLYGWADQAGGAEDIRLLLKALGAIGKKWYFAFRKYNLALPWASILGDKLGDVAAVQARDGGDPVRAASAEVQREDGGLSSPAGVASSAPLTSPAFVYGLSTRTALGYVLKPAHPTRT